MAQAPHPQTSPQKKRLTGFILLVLMIAIAAPFVVRSPEEVRVALDLEIPPAPVMPVMPETVVVAEDALEAVEQRLAEVSPGLHPAPTQDLPPETEPETPDDSPPVAEKAPVAEGWSVQLASFAEEANAAAMVKKLRDAGYAAYSRANGGQTLYRVYAGPELEREQAVRLRARLAADSRIALEGLVVAYAL